MVCSICRGSGKLTQFHNGVDLPAAQGVPISVPWDGVITKAWFDKKVSDGGFGGGFSIVVKHTSTWRSLSSNDIDYSGYAHMVRHSDGLVIGNEYPAGTVIGFVGSTGDSTGNHLHLTFRKTVNDKIQAIDPLPYLLESCKICEIPYHGVGE
jgi:murein DD-endopeptidase MepM/ murein hydrolase activator NlpD